MEGATIPARARRLATGGRAQRAAANHALVRSGRWRGHVTGRGSRPEKRVEGPSSAHGIQSDEEPESLRAVYGGTKTPAGAPHAQPCTCMMTSWSTSRRASALRPEEMSGRPPGRPPSRQCPPWTLGPWWPRAWTPRPPQRPPRIDTDVAAPIVLTVTLTGTGRRRERAASPDTAGRDGRRGALPRRGARWSRRLRRGCTQRHPRPPGRLHHGADGRQTWTTRFGGGRPRDSRVCGRSRCHCRGHQPPPRPPG